MWYPTGIPTRNEKTLSIYALDFIRGVFFKIEQELLKFRFVIQTIRERVYAMNTTEDTVFTFLNRHNELRQNRKCMEQRNGPFRAAYITLKN